MWHWIQRDTLKCLFVCRVCLFSFSSLLLYIAFLLQLLHWMLTLEVTNTSTSMEWRQSIPVEHSAARDKLVLTPKGAFKTRPLSVGALLVTELLLGACWGIHCAVDYFLLRWKQASSSVMKDLMFVLLWCCLDTVMTDVFKAQIILQTIEHY